MADVCDDDGVSGASLRRKGAEKLLFFFYTLRIPSDLPERGILLLFSIAEIMLDDIADLFAYLRL